MNVNKDLVKDVVNAVLAAMAACWGLPALGVESEDPKIWAAAVLVVLAKVLDPTDGGYGLVKEQKKDPQE